MVQNRGPSKDLKRQASQSEMLGVSDPCLDPYSRSIIIYSYFFSARVTFYITRRYITITFLLFAYVRESCHFLRAARAIRRHHRNMSADVRLQLSEVCLKVFSKVSIRPQGI